MTGKKRLRGFLLHLFAYFLVTIVGFGLNIALAPERVFVWLPLLLWGGVVAIHCAWVMGLVGTRSQWGRE